jgi:4-diphosphocytidyl-2-C-methyl-D-erythritol kinase
MYVLRSGSSIEVRAPAKLNLFLEILARRADGYHEIETLMVGVDIFDTLTFSPCDGSDLRLDCRWVSGQQARQVAQRRESAYTPHSSLGELPQGNDNLVLQALERLRLRAAVQFGAWISLRKRIPSAAGLGGASSDAAAVLVAANAAWNLGWSHEQLSAVAAELGSDIPFFLGVGSRGNFAAICRGRGERIEPLQGIPKMYFVVVRPPVGLSTAGVYRNCRIVERPKRLQTLLAAACRGDVAAVGRNLTNRLQDAAECLSPWIERMRREFSRFDCLGHQMSGSGTSYFGICRHTRHARRVAAQLDSRGLGTVFCTSTISAPHSCFGQRRREANPA